MTLQETLESTKAGFLQSNEMLKNALATTPDDKLLWKASPTARTVIAQVVHSADSIKHIHGFCDGRPFTVPTAKEADEQFHAYEAGFKTREEALALLEANSAAFLAWLDTVTEPQLDTMVTLPFDLGQAPTRMAIGFPAQHTTWHIAQIEYIQTIYGDNLRQ